jgi:hypothetical protein
MKSIRNFFRAIDIFGVTYNFRYQSKEKYQTAIGGFIILLFLVPCISNGNLLFHSLYKQEKLYHSLLHNELSSHRKVNLFDSESNFAVGLTCENNDLEKRKIGRIIGFKKQDMFCILKAEMVLIKKMLQIL